MQHDSILDSDFPTPHAHGGIDSNSSSVTAGTSLRTLVIVAGIHTIYSEKRSNCSRKTGSTCQKICLAGLQSKVTHNPYKSDQFGPTSNRLRAATEVRIMPRLPIFRQWIPSDIVQVSATRIEGASFIAATRPCVSCLFPQRGCSNSCCTFLSDRSSRPVAFPW